VRASGLDHLGLGRLGLGLGRGRQIVRLSRRLEGTLCICAVGIVVDSGGELHGVER
jgi:hypothetical protein